MQLSINAIVVLVIAMLVLGLGLGLINGVLSFGGDTLASAIEGYRLEIPASASNPLVVADPLVLERNTANVVFTNIYNQNTPSCDDSDSLIGAWLYLQCPALDFIRFQTQVVDIPISSQKAVGIIIDTPPTLDSGTYPCTLHLYCERRDTRTGLHGKVTDDPTSNAVISKSLFVRVD